MGIKHQGAFWYRIASCAVLLTLGAAFGFGRQAISAANKKEEDTLHELTAFRLSMEKLRRAAQAERVLKKLSGTDPSLKTATQFGRHRGLLAIDETVTRIDDHAQVQAAIEKAGLSTRTYVLTMYCFEQSAQALFVTDNSDQKRPMPGASKANVVFVQKHLKEINRLFTESP